MIWVRGFAFLGVQSHEGICYDRFNPAFNLVVPFGIVVLCFLHNCMFISLRKSLRSSIGGLFVVVGFQIH